MWPFKTKKQRGELQETAGFNWAAGELLRGRAVEEVYSYVECAVHFNDYSAFDKGVETAIKAYERR